MRPLHLEVHAPYVVVGVAEIDASPHLLGTFLQDGEEGGREAVGGLLCRSSTEPILR